MAKFILVIIDQPFVKHQITHNFKIRVIVTVAIPPAAITTILQANFIATAIVIITDQGKIPNGFPVEFAVDFPIVLAALGFPMAAKLVACSLTSHFSTRSSSYFLISSTSCAFRRGPYVGPALST